MNFNFENIYIIGDKEDRTDTKMNCDLTCYENDNNEIYTYIWDNEEELIKWKESNAIDTQYNLIDFNEFCTLFIFQQTGLKWILLNASPDVTDYEEANKIGIDKLMLFSVSGVKQVLNYHASLQKDNFYKSLIKECISNNPDLLPSDFFSVLSKMIEETSSSISNLSAPDIFEKDLLLKHVVLNKIQYYDSQKEEFIDVKLELFGHCFKIICTHDDLEIKAVFDPKREIECRVTNEDTANDSSYIVNIGAPKSITYSYPMLDMDDYTFSPDVADSGFTTFILSKSNFNKLKKHFQKTNKTINLLEDNFNVDINSIVSDLLKNVEIVEMGETFIDKIPAYFYTNIQYLIVVDHLIYIHNNFGRSLLLTSREMNDLYIDTLTNFAVDNSNEISSYLEDYFEMFSQVLRDDYGVPEDKSSLSTYVFLYNIVIEQLSKKWTEKHKHLFQDINSLDLDQAIDRYCSIETIVHTDNITIGEFVYYLIKNSKFGKNNNNYFKCYNIFIPKLNNLIKNKKYNNFVSQLKKTSNSVKNYSINDVDLMDGLEFERFIAELFLKMGYESEITKASGDQGIDVIASKNGTTIGIQAKCYSSTVGNSAIQEAVAGINHYRLDKAIVVTNNFFTTAAQQLAQSNSIILWDRNILKEKIDEVF